MAPVTNAGQSSPRRPSRREAPGESPRSRRNAVIVVLFAAAALTAVALLVWLKIAAERQERRASQAGERAPANLRREEARVQQKRQRQAESHVQKGDRLLNQGNLLASLPWFAEALWMERTEPPRADVHHKRLADLLDRSPKLVQLWFHEGAVNVATFSPDGRHVATASRDGTARIREVTVNGWVSPPLRHDGPVLHVAFSPGGDRVVTAGEDHTARLWDAATGESIAGPLKHNGRVSFAEFSLDGQRVVTAGGGAACVWRTATGELLTRLQHADSDGEVMLAGFSPSGEQVLTVAANAAWVWEVRTGEQLFPPIQHRPGKIIHHAAFRPDGQTILTAGGGGVRLWNASTGEPISPWPGQEASTFHAAFSPDGRQILTATDDGGQLWEADAATLLASGLGKVGAIYAAFSKWGGLLLLVNDSGQVRVVDKASGELAVPPLTHTADVYHACFDPTGRFVAAALADGNVRVWDLAGAMAGGTAGDRRPEDWISTAELLAGYRLGSRGAPSIDPAGTLITFHSLRSKYPKDFTASVQEVQQWERARQPGQEEAVTD